jgi:hypothetical protein
LEPTGGVTSPAPARAAPALGVRAHPAPSQGNLRLPEALEVRAPTCCSRTRRRPRHRWTVGPPMAFSPVHAFLLRLAAVRDFNAKVPLTVRMGSRTAPSRRLFKGRALLLVRNRTPAGAITAAPTEPPLHSLPDLPDYLGTLPSTHSTPPARVSSKPRRPFAGARASAAGPQGCHLATPPVVVSNPPSPETEPWGPAGRSRPRPADPAAGVRRSSPEFGHPRRRPWTRATLQGLKSF